jgi:hypothetical protein
VSQIADDNTLSIISKNAIIVFQSYGLDLKDSHNTYFLLSKLLNPKNIIECNYLYKFIRDALEIRNTS